MPSTWSAIRRGLRCRCPKCGTGRLLSRSLNVVAKCPVCQEPLDRYVVGLLLPFAVMMVTANALIFVMLLLELYGSPSPIGYLSVLVPMGILIPLAIFPSAKGGIVGLLWKKNLSDDAGGLGG